MLIGAPYSISGITPKFSSLTCRNYSKFERNFETNFETKVRQPSCLHDVHQTSQLVAKELK